MKCYETHILDGGVGREDGFGRSKRHKIRMVEDLKVYVVVVAPSNRFV